MLPTIDADVRAAYPAEWARANSKQRNKLRRRWRDDQAMTALRADGAQCRSCKHYANGVCGAHSTTFDGICAPSPDYLCLDWKARP